jgi:sporulation protein YlmC with PRC-barrel domain
MLDRAHHLYSIPVMALDGVVGRVADVLYDDVCWTIRYLVMDTGRLLPGRKVLVSPNAVKPLAAAADHIELRLTRRQIANSPDIDAGRPISREQECELADSCGFPKYWRVEPLSGTGGYPRFPAASAAQAELAANQPARDARLALPGGVLRRAAKVRGHAIHATDGRIGRVADVLFDNETWAIRYFVVKTRRYWPGSTSVLIGVHWIERVDWAQQVVRVAITTDQVRSSPVYDGRSPVHRDYQVRLHSAYDRTGYWD